MKISQFIRKAVDGGWRYNDSQIEKVDPNEPLRYVFIRTQKGTSAVSHEVIFLDPKAWKAVGKTEGWGFLCQCGCGDSSLFEGDSNGPKYKFSRPEWLDKMHRMIDAFAEGKTIEQYLETL